MAAKPKTELIISPDFDQAAEYASQRPQGTCLWVLGDNYRKLDPKLCVLRRLPGWNSTRYTWGQASAVATWLRKARPRRAPIG